MKKVNLLAAAVIAMSLSACGGGGGGGDDAGDDPSVSVDKYLGTWESICDTSEMRAAAAPTVALKQKWRLILTKVANNKVSFVMVTDIYPTAGCTGTPLATQTNDASANSVVIDGTGTIGGAAVGKITFTLSNVGGISAGTTITLNGIVYPGDYFMRTAKYKDVIQLTGSTLLMGDADAALDSAGYPSALDASFPLTKK